MLSLFRKQGTRLLVLEESIAALAPQIALACNPCPVRSLAIPNIPVAQGTVAQQRERFGFNREMIKAILAELEEL